MRKLKLQMNFAGIAWDNVMVDFCLENLKNVDGILLGRNTAEGFIPYWADVAKNPLPDDINASLGKPLTDIPKIIFSNKLSDNHWENTTILRGVFADQIKKLKTGNGKDIIVYGGNLFASSLVEHRFIDEYYLLVNPLAFSNDEPILKFINNDLQLNLKEARPFPCGTVLLRYTQQT
jgi:dihydrofolate reductase